MRRNLTITMVTLTPRWFGLNKHFFVESLLLRIRLSTGKKIVAKFEFLPSKSLSKFSMDFSEPCMIVWPIILIAGILLFVALCKTFGNFCHRFLRFIDSSSMDSSPETAAPTQVPFQQSNTPKHPPTMQSYQGPPPYAESTWN